MSAVMTEPTDAEAQAFLDTLIGPLGEDVTTLVELGADAVPVTRRVALRPRRDLRIITGTLDELLEQPDAVLSRDDYLSAQLTDTSPVLDPMLRLREVYPNILDMQLARQAEGQVGTLSGGDHRQPGRDAVPLAIERNELCL